jgi:glutamyl-tRNA reductase
VQLRTQRDVEAQRLVFQTLQVLFNLNTGEVKSNFVGPISTVEIAQKNINVTQVMSENVKVAQMSIENIEVHVKVEEVIARSAI